MAERMTPERRERLDALRDKVSEGDIDAIDEMLRLTLSLGLAPPRDPDRIELHLAERKVRAIRFLSLEP